MGKSKVVMVRMEPDLHERTSELARQSERTVSQEIRLALKEHLRSDEEAEGTDACG